MARKNRESASSWDVEPEEFAVCPLCERLIPDDQREEYFLIPKTKGGKKAVSLHRVCRDQIHASFTDSQLAKKFSTIASLLEDPAIQKFVAWIKGKHPGFSDSAKESLKASGPGRGRKH